VFLTDDYRIALIDLGMVGRIMPNLQEQLLQLLLAIAEGRGDDAADIAIKVGDTKENFDEVQFRRRITEIVAKQQGANVENMQVGRLVLEVTQVSGESNIRVPVRAHDARQNAAQSRSSRPHYRAGLRPERVDPSNAGQIMQQRLNEEPLARQSLQRRARTERLAAAPAHAHQQDPRRAFDQ
jgi:predicted unusual protein kinase regulating ubiquinone biosynthesis (AarF/ABC1/UbiB family)